MPSGGQDDRHLPHPHRARVAPDGGGFLVADNDEVIEDRFLAAGSSEEGSASAEAAATGEGVHGFAVLGEAALEDDVFLDEANGHGIVVGNADATPATDAQAKIAAASEAAQNSAAKDTSTETASEGRAGYGFVILEDGETVDAPADPPGVAEAYGFVLLEKAAAATGTPDEGTSDK
jgi:hypothetical protein